MGIYVENDVPEKNNITFFSLKDLYCFLIYNISLLMWEKYLFLILKNNQNSFQ